MKKYVFLILLATLFHTYLPAQTKANQTLPFEVRKIDPYINLDYEQLQTAETLMDINPHFPTEWIKEYIQVEVSTEEAGLSRRTRGLNANLSPQQKEQLLSADENTRITIDVQYYPNNNLKQVEVREFNFSFIVQPSQDARFPGGLEALQDYFQNKAIKTIPDSTFTGYDLAVITFTIDESGAVQDVQLFESSKNKATDQLLIETVSGMPCWQPASFYGGQPAVQKFAFTVGNHDNCILNLVGTRRPF